MLVFYRSNNHLSVIECSEMLQIEHFISTDETQLCGSSV